jgi:hypothetical protein
VPAPRTPPRAQPQAKPKGLEILARLADKLSDQQGMEASVADGGDTRLSDGQLSDSSAVTGQESRAVRHAGDTQQPLIVDAENAGKMLGVTPRTARRLLRTLVEEGLAWPLPPNRTPQPGRPRQLYRLIVEKLGPKAPG